MTRHRVLIDIEFTLDETQLKLAQIGEGMDGISDVTDAEVRRAIASELAYTNWKSIGVSPLRSIVTTRHATHDGTYPEVSIPADAGVISSPD